MSAPYNCQRPVRATPTFIHAVSVALIPAPPDRLHSCRVESELAIAPESRHVHSIHGFEHSELLNSYAPLC